MRFHVLLNLFASQILRIKSSSRRRQSRTDERFVIVEKIESRGVNPEVAAQRFILWIVACRERLVQRQSVRIYLSPVDFLEKTRSVHQLLHQFHLARGQAGGAERHLYAAELGEPLLEVRNNLHAG